MKSELAYISHPTQHDSSIIIKSTYIEPWTHSQFVPLPNAVIQRLRHVNPVEMPRRQAFDSSLEAFQKDIMPALQETALFSVQKYDKLVDCLETGDVSSLTDRMRSWVSMHRLCSGSSKHNIVLVPRDSVFSMDEVSAETGQKEFVKALLNGKTGIEQLQVRDISQCKDFI